MEVWAANRTGRPLEYANKTVSGDAWRDLLPSADFVISSVPLTSESRGMLSATEFGRFRPNAWLINVGRGATIDEPALLQAVRNGVIAGAAIDAWSAEPLPADHPAWELENIIVSPHCAASSPLSPDPPTLILQGAG